MWAKSPALSHRAQEGRGTRFTRCSSGLSAPMNAESAVSAQTQGPSTPPITAVTVIGSGGDDRFGKGNSCIGPSSRKERAPQDDSVGGGEKAPQGFNSSNSGSRRRFSTLRLP